MKPGETARLDCGDCLAEFEVTYEPKARGNPQQAKGIPSNMVKHCPFCGSVIDSDSDDE